MLELKACVGSHACCEEKIHDHLPCLLSAGSEWWRLTVACLPEEQNGVAQAGIERILTPGGPELSSRPSQSHDLALATSMVQT